MDYGVVGAAMIEHIRQAARSGCPAVSDEFLKQLETACRRPLRLRKRSGNPKARGRYPSVTIGSLVACPPISPVSLTDATQLPTLASNQFAFVGVKPDSQGRLRSNTLYIRLTQYLYVATGQMRFADDLDSVAVVSTNAATGKVVKVPGLVVSGDPVVAVPDTSGNSPVWKVALQHPLDSTATVYVQNQLQMIMDWTPYLNWTTPNQWHFAQTDLQQLCVRKVCTQ